MYERFNKYTLTRPRTKKIVGWFFVVIGFVALITPLTPGGILFFIGLEVLGIRFIGTEKVKHFFTHRGKLVATETVTVETQTNA